MSKNIIITSKSHNPWHNLALEEFLFDHIEDDTRTVGRNAALQHLKKTEDIWPEDRPAVAQYITIWGIYAIPL